MTAVVTEALEISECDRKLIPVTHVPEEVPLGTEDGAHYSVYPQLPDDDEEGLHGRSGRG